jgi:hypothetical protein
VRVHHDTGMDLPHQRRIYGVHQHRHQAHHRQRYMTLLATPSGHVFEGLHELIHAEVLRPTDRNLLTAQGGIEDGKLDGIIASLSVICAQFR